MKAVVSDEQHFAQIADFVTSNIDAQEALKLEADELEGVVSGLVREAMQKNTFLMNIAEQHAISAEIVNDMVRLGPLQKLMDDPYVTDIMVNGPHKVYIERHGKIELSPVRFRNDEHVLNMAKRIANSASRRVDESSPMVDARLSDGSRVNIIIPPLSINGPCISIRKFVREKMNLDDLVEAETLNADMARVVELGVRARLNILVSGGTGAGKTTLLNAMSAYIGEHERVITIEDAAELRLQQPHVISLETRDSSIEGKGRVTQRDLLRNTLRMRPERIILGECRGEEAFDMLQAMNTGHDGSLSTLHANTPSNAIDRLQDMLSLGSAGLNMAHISHQIATSVEWLIQIERGVDGLRRVTHICEIHFEDGQAVTKPIFKYDLDDEGSGHFVQVNPLTQGLEKFRKYGLMSMIREQFRHVP